LTKNVVFPHLQCSAQRQMPGVGGEKGLMPTSPHLFMSMLAGPTEQNLPPTRFRHLSLSIAFEYTKNHAFGQRMPQVGGEKRLMPLVPISPTSLRVDGSRKGHQ